MNPQLLHVEAGLTVGFTRSEEREHSWEIVRRRITSFMNQLEFFSSLSHYNWTSLINRRTINQCLHSGVQSLFIVVVIPYVLDVIYIKDTTF